MTQMTSGFRPRLERPGTVAAQGKGTPGGSSNKTWETMLVRATVLAFNFWLSVSCANQIRCTRTFFLPTNGKGPQEGRELRALYPHVPQSKSPASPGLPAGRGQWTLTLPIRCRREHCGIGWSPAAGDPHLQGEPRS